MKYSIYDVEEALTASKKTCLQSSRNSYGWLGLEIELLTASPKPPPQQQHNMSKT
jgi:hypothetical protein